MSTEVILDKLENVLSRIKSTNLKLRSATKFMDSFVHDILDYAVLQNSISNFVKEFKVFDIRETIEEIIEILNNKILMKDL